MASTPDLPSDDSFVVYQDDHYNNNKSKKPHSTYTPGSTGLNEKATLPDDYQHNGGNEDADYGSLQIGSAAWVIVYDDQNFAGSCHRFHNTNVYDLDDVDRVTGVDNDETVIKGGHWDNSIRSWRLSSSKLYDAENMAFAFIQTFAPWGYPNDDVADLDNKGSGTDFDHTPDTDTFPYPATHNRAIDVYQSHSRYRIFWPFLLQTDNILTVYLEVENINTDLGNEAGYVLFSIDTKTGQLQDDFKITYYAPDADDVNFWYKFAEGSLLFGTAAMEYFAAALEDYDGEYTAAEAETAAADATMAAVFQTDTLGTGIIGAFNESDDGFLCFPGIVAHAVLRAYNVVVQQIASEATSAEESSLYGRSDQLTPRTLDFDTLATQLDVDWNYHTWNPCLEFEASGTSKNFRLYLPQYTGPAGSTTLLCTANLEAMNASTNESAGNDHLALAVVFAADGTPILLNAFYNHYDPDDGGWSVGRTGLIYYGDDNVPQQVLNNVDADPTVNVADASFAGDLMGYFQSLLGDLTSASSYSDAYAVAVAQVVDALAGSASN